MSEDQIHSGGLSRRRFLLGSTAIAGSLLVPSAYAAIAKQPERRLTLQNLHTGEKARITYWSEGDYLKDSLLEINHLLRDHRTGDKIQMDRQLLDLLFSLQKQVESKREFQVISGYRSPKTNAMLRSKSKGVARKSLHMQGKALDIRLPGTDLKHLRKAAIALKSGGVGYYPKSNFIHVDTGRVRYW
jgi:uncharacterized protein YcbK (DUF882 family)